MSAQTSQTSLGSNAASKDQTSKERLLEHVTDNSSDKHAEQTHLSDSAATNKRKFEGEDDPAASSSNKRSRTETWQQDNTIEVSINTASIDSTLQGLGLLYKVGQQPHPTSQPHTSENLVSLYNLDGIAAGLARKDPKTGEKINKLRKSYENQIKDLPGKTKATNSSGELLNLLNYPDEEWQIQRVSGKDVTQGLGDEMMSKLALAVQMDTTKLPSPEYDKWKNTIAFEESQTKVGNPPTGPRPAAAPTLHHTSADAAAPEPARASRRGVKRRYDDESFEGYGEGFVDDSGANALHDDADDSISSAKRKKPRRDTAGSPRYATFGSVAPNNAVSVGNR